jgi:hypothetical protein
MTSPLSRARPLLTRIKTQQLRHRFGCSTMLSQREFVGVDMLRLVDTCVCVIVQVRERATAGLVRKGEQLQNISRLPRVPL